MRRVMMGALNPSTAVVFEVISVQTAASTAQIDFTTSSAFTSRYDNLILHINGYVPSTDDAEPFIRVSQAGTFATGAAAYKYANAICYDDTDTATFAQRSTGAAQIALGSTVAGQGPGNATGEGLSGYIFFDNVTSSNQYKRMTWSLTVNDSTTGRIQNVDGSGAFISNTSGIDGIRIVPATGKIDSGKFILIGARNLFSG